jgi:dethiobiotin synthetase
MPRSGDGRPRGLFVTGTDTEVGKTVVASAIAATLAAGGERVSVFKPVVTGLDQPEDGLAADHERLRAAARSEQPPGDVAPYRFGPPVSPHLAAAAIGERVDPYRLRAAARRAVGGGDVLVAEGVGGLLVPLSGDYLVRDLAADLGMPIVVAARPGLGTISHTLMTIECARVAGLEVAGVVLTPWPAQAGEMERSNRETIARLGRVDVETLPALAVRAIGPQRHLPLDRWLRNRPRSDVTAISALQGQQTPAPARAA